MELRGAKILKSSEKLFLVPLKRVVFCFEMTCFGYNHSIFLEPREKPLEEKKISTEFPKK